MRHQLDVTKYAIIYPRQSTGEQVKENIYSLERQMRLRELAIEHGFEEEKILVVDDDLGRSGRRIELRPGFSRALRLIDQGVVAAIYVEDLTRLSRDERTIDQMVIADACEKAETLIYMGGSWYDMRDPAQRMSYKYQAVGLSESWKAHLQKLHGAQRDKARQGKCASRPPDYGYRVNREVGRRHPDRDKLIPDPGEAAIIKAIAAKVIEVGSIREAYRQINPTYWPNGKLVTYRTVCKVLTHPVYRGHYAWGDEIVENSHEPIITPEMAAQIDRIRDINRAVKRKEPKAGGILVGFIYCATCNRKMYGSRSNVRPDYRCSRNHPYEVTDGPRSHFCVGMNVLDRLVLEDLWRQLDAGLVGKVLKELQGQEAEKADVTDLAEANRRALQRKIDGLSKSLADPDISEMSRKILLQQLEQTAKELEMLEDHHRPRNQHLAEDIAFYEKLRKNPGFLASLPLTWDDEPIDWRRSWIRRFIERVEVTNPSRGCYDVAIHYLNGEVSRGRHYTKPGVTEEELTLVRRLWDDPERPDRYYAEWMIGRLQEHGFHREKRGIYRTLRLALGLKTK